MTEPLVAVTLGRLRGPQRLAWAEGTAVHLPAGVAEALERRRNASGTLILDDGEPLADPAAAGALRLRAAFTDRMPVSSRLPVSYRRVPAPLRLAAARAMGAWQRRRVSRWAAFPGWPLDLSADFLADLAGEGGPLHTGRTPVLLTHDLDSPEGLANLTDRFLAAEEGVGARSTSFVVPRAWPVDLARLDEARDRGHEVGIHGYDHANRTPFAPPEERCARLDAARDLARRVSARGYRAPSLLRTRALLEDLAGRYRYDSSIPTSGGLFPVPNNGCASARPFRLGGLWEVPLSLPRDGSLLFLGHDTETILTMWQSAALRIAAARGAVCLLTHCEDSFSGRPALFAAYRRFLDWVAADDRFEFMTITQMLDRIEAGAGSVGG